MGRRNAVPRHRVPDRPPSGVRILATLKGCIHIAVALSWGTCTFLQGVVWTRFLDSERRDRKGGGSVINPRPQIPDLDRTLCIRSIGRDTRGISSVSWALRS